MLDHIDVPKACSFPKRRAYAVDRETLPVSRPMWKMSAVPLWVPQLWVPVYVAFVFKVTKRPEHGSARVAGVSD